LGSLSKASANCSKTISLILFAPYHWLFQINLYSISSLLERSWITMSSSTTTFTSG
jgi:hypothetical protein